jgi:hypothetical protein
MVVADMVLCHHRARVATEAWQSRRAIDAVMDRIPCLPRLRRGAVR